MTQDFLEDFKTALSNENMQFVIAVVDKDNKDYHISFNTNTDIVFDRLIEILHQIKDTE